MKKIILIISLFLLIIPIVAYALDSQSQNVVVGNVEQDDAIDVSITWNDMVFTYVVENNYEWDSETHKYIKQNPNRYWKASNNQIIVKNNSKRSVHINAQFENKIDSINGSFSSNDFDIEQNSEKSFYFVIDGTISSKNNNVNAGFITLEIR